MVHIYIHSRRLRSAQTYQHHSSSLFLFSLIKHKNQTHLTSVVSFPLFQYSQSVIKSYAFWPRCMSASLCYHLDVWSVPNRTREGKKGKEKDRKERLELRGRFPPK